VFKIILFNGKLANFLLATDDEDYLTAAESKHSRFF
jgi:hypothetical protein